MADINKRPKTGGRKVGTPNKDPSAKAAAKVAAADARLELRSAKKLETLARRKRAEAAARAAKGQSVRYNPAADLASGKKRCPKCRDTKPTSDFHTSPNHRSGFRVECKVCLLRYRRERYAADEAVRKYSADLARRKNYGLSASDFNLLLCEQAGRCKACDDALGAGRGRMHVDHDHATGKVRGLLCHGCNVAIGNAKDSPHRLRLMAGYLEASPGV